MWWLVIIAIILTGLFTLIGVFVGAALAERGQDRAGRNY